MNTPKYENTNAQEHHTEKSLLLKVAQDALMEGALHVKSMFGKSIKEIGLEYKIKDGDTPRTMIDTNAEASILSVIRQSPFKEDILNAEESGKSGAARSRRTWHIDPYDGTSNADIKLGMSTMGIGIQKDKMTIVAVALNPFEKEMIYAVEGQGVYSVPITFDNGKCVFLGEHPKRLEPRIKNHAKERYAWIDALGNNKTSPRKTGWMNEIFDLAQNWRMTGSNIDYSMKIASGRGDIQLTDAVGGFFDIAPGILFFKELGGAFMDLNGNEPVPGCEVAVGYVDPKLRDPLLEITNKHYGYTSPNGQYTGFR